jgi:hypothetical protein
MQPIVCMYGKSMSMSMSMSTYVVLTEKCSNVVQGIKKRCQWCSLPTVCTRPRDSASCGLRNNEGHSCGSPAPPQSRCRRWTPASASRSHAPSPAVSAETVRLDCGAARRRTVAKVDSTVLERGAKASVYLTSYSFFSSGVVFGPHTSSIARSFGDTCRRVPAAATRRVSIPTTGGRSVAILSLNKPTGERDLRPTFAGCNR